MKQNSVILPPKRTGNATLNRRLTDNVYHNLLPARYLRKNERGDVIESQEEIFDRVARNIAVAEIVFESQNREIEITVTPDQLKPHYENKSEVLNEVFGKAEAATLNPANAAKFDYNQMLSAVPRDIQEHAQEHREAFRAMMEHLDFIPNSPTLMNAGTPLQQLSACFVTSPSDSISNIHRVAKEAAELFHSGSGIGYSFSQLRPYGDVVASTGEPASGPVTFMKTFDQILESVSRGGTRRGAQMAVMNIEHPDIIDFIHAKDKDVSLAESLDLADSDDYKSVSYRSALKEARALIDEKGRVPVHLRNAVEGHLSNFNMSVGVSDQFMQALEKGEEYVFTNPRTDEPHTVSESTVEMYSWYGLDNHLSVGDRMSLPAEVIWEHLVESAHENGEPGVVFLNLINRDHSFDIHEHPDHSIHAVNPCGEEPLEEYEACNLGHINISTIVSDENLDWRNYEARGDLEDQVQQFLNDAIDWDDLNERIRLGTRFLDDVITMSEFPVEAIEQKVRRLRKIGLGIMGLAQLYVQLGVRYGSDVGDEIARQLMRQINHRSKWISHELAIERGCFNGWSESKYAEPNKYPDWFADHTGHQADEWDDGFPIRNHGTTCIAPTGSTSMIGNTTPGCEPMYNVAYYKNVSRDVQGDDMLVEFDSYFLEVLKENGIDPELVKQEAEEQMSKNSFDGIAGLQTVPEGIGELFVVASDISAEDHADVQCALQEGVDGGISKTINLPNAATKGDIDEVFRYVYQHGGKGVTVYRDGTRTKQVLTTRHQNTEFSDE